MKANRRVGFRIVVPLVLFEVISVIWAQEVPFKLKQIDEPVPLSKQAKTIPISQTLIRLKIIVDDAEPVIATQHEGGMIRIAKEKEEDTWIYGLTPYISDQASGAIAVRLFRISRITKKGMVVGEGIAELETVELGKEANNTLARFSTNEPRLTIQLMTMQREPKSRARMLPQSDPPPPIIGDGTCCVTCNGIRTCSCAVSANCGTCCIGDCCN